MPGTVLVVPQLLCLCAWLDPDIALYIRNLWCTLVVGVCYGGIEKCM